MKDRGQYFHLIFEHLGKLPLGKNEKSGSLGALPILPIEIPDQGGYLLVTQDKRPHLVLNKPWSNVHDLLFFFEPFTLNRSLGLLMLSINGHAWINGQPAQPVALLNVRDEVRFGISPYIAHVSLFIRVGINSPSVQEIGKPCPICRVQFDSKTLVYTCSWCSQLLHCEGEEKPQEHRLECARICSACPTCQTPIVLETGYSYLPPFCQEVQ